MLSMLRLVGKKRLAVGAQTVVHDLAGQREPNRSFSQPQAAFKRAFTRLNSFMVGHVRGSIETAAVAPLTPAASDQSAPCSEALFGGVDRNQSTRHYPIGSHTASSGSVDQACRHSATVIDEIGRSGILTDQVMQRMHTMGQDIDRLTGTMAQLDHQSRTIDSIIENISDIVVHTGLLSLNASIESARAGAQGAGFGIIAQEIRQLSRETSLAAMEVKNSLLAVSELIKETVGAVEQMQERVALGVRGSREASAGLRQVDHQNHRQFHAQLESVINSVGDQLQAVARLADALAKIANIGKDGKNNSNDLAELAENIKTLTEQQLLATGLFILPQYRQVEEAVAAVAKDPDLFAPTDRTDKALQQHLQQLPYFELMYVTDTEGVQISSSIHRQGMATMCNPASKGRDWSDREWFRNVRDKQRSYISDMYKSEATDAFCLTISVPVYCNGNWAGVLGADINFADLFAI
ncbi:MAG: methyl-accepting chemotaxis protein [Desulfobulbus sp.]|jgi:methyl-accepting chemotaxis protein|uniref:methyl-accepting chemotaxis protein n=1 Tax=Desulfobulbus sp. TaxID=895 RepID=UPI002849A96B|nr:methyl-accepting chemotaxis protein [Desulfobulbus sp.]MDR2551038.1 methyl-accepting chemotaxis protein [Desulfobulbus sp.]